MLGAGANVDGAANEEAATADVVIVTVPFGGQAEIYRSIKDHVKADAIVVDCTSPLATAVGGRAWQWSGRGTARPPSRPRPSWSRCIPFGWWARSIRSRERRCRTSSTRWRATSWSAGPTRRRRLSSAAWSTRSRWVDAGDLTQARTLEPLTALLISINRSYKIRDAGIADHGTRRVGAPDS